MKELEDIFKACSSPNPHDQTIKLPWSVQIKDNGRMRPRAQATAAFPRQEAVLFNNVPVAIGHVDTEMPSLSFDNAELPSFVPVAVARDGATWGPQDGHFPSGP